MTNLILSTLILFSTSFAAAAISDEASILKAEYKRFNQLVSTLTPDGKIGDFMNYKKIDTYELLWDLGETSDDYSVIKIFNEHTDGTNNFFVTYYLSQDIVPGKTVIRRFIGPLMGSDWRNDTVDVDAGDYLGTQGMTGPLMNQEDLKLIQKLEIKMIQ